VNNPKASIKTTKKVHELRSADWRVRPGYSSGASSFSDSDENETTEDVDFAKDRSRHSDILALSRLREEMVADGDLAKTVVRIETPFGKPIEEIYDGVHDGPVLGSGVSGIVRLVIHRATGVKYAVKCLDIGLIDSTEGLRALRNEIFIMCQLDHPNVVRIEEVYESVNEIYILQELCVGGDLFDRLDEQTDYHYTEAQCAHLVKQMLSSVRYLHSKGIIHRDLKLENFLFSSIKVESELKMIDFGLSKHFVLGEHHHEQVGTPYTVAPEIIRGAYDEKSDIWALGVITYLLLSGETPFGGLDGEDLMLVKENIMRAEVLFEPKEVWESVSDAGKNFVKTLLNPEPTLRPTARETQKNPWIQVWAKKDVKEGDRLNSRTIDALMNFKEQSDMQKLLSEVLSFTLLPEQIVELRSEFEKIDTDGDGEISLEAMKRVLMGVAEGGALGALTEQEIETLFESIRFSKSEPTIRWHEFLAAGLSQARVDDRNLRLAFDRMDTDRKGYITFDDLKDLLGRSTESDALERIWMESLEECKARLNRITFEDFKRLMKGQPKDHVKVIPPLTVSALRNAEVSVGINSTDKNLRSAPGHLVSGLSTEGLTPVREEKTNGIGASASDLELLDQQSDSHLIYKKKRSHSHEPGSPLWVENERNASGDLRDSSRAVMLPGHVDGLHEEVIKDMNMSPLVINRALYRKHREMRTAVLDASKQFDEKRTERLALPRAALIMKRGATPPVELTDMHNRAMFEAAAKRCGRARRTRNKTVSDVTGMLINT
jgi:calcium-dependent protein kinase